MSNSSTQITWKPRFGEYKAPEQTVQSALNEMHQKLYQIQEVAVFLNCRDAMRAPPSLTPTQ